MKSALSAADDESPALDRQLKLYNLTPPCRGRVGRLLIVRGQTLSVGAPVADLIDVEEQINVLCFVPPSVAQIEVGQCGASPAWIAARPKSATDAEGKVDYIADQAETDTGHIAVKVRISEPRTEGLRANTVIVCASSSKPDKECWAIPGAAIKEDGPADRHRRRRQGRKASTGRQNGRVGQRPAGEASSASAIGSKSRSKLFGWRTREKRPGEVELKVIVIESGQGLQTGDAVKLEVDEDDRWRRPKPQRMLNLASRASYFGAVVLTCVLLTAGGIYTRRACPAASIPK